MQAGTISIVISFRIIMFSIRVVSVKIERIVLTVWIVAGVRIL